MHPAKSRGTPAQFAEELQNRLPAILNDVKQVIMNRPLPQLPNMQQQMADSVARAAQPFLNDLKALYAVYGKPFEDGVRKAWEKMAASINAALPKRPSGEPVINDEFRRKLIIDPMLARLKDLEK